MEIVKITKENFESEVINSKTPVLIDFYANWCGPCKMLAPILDEIAAETDAVKIGKINVDDEMKLAMKFGIQSIPTLIVIKDKKAVAQSIGFQSKAQILAMLED